MLMACQCLSAAEAAGAGAPCPCNWLVNQFPRPCNQRETGGLWRGVHRVTAALSGSMVYVHPAHPPLKRPDGTSLPEQTIVASLERDSHRITVGLHAYSWVEIGDTEILEMPEGVAADGTPFSSYIGKRYNRPQRAMQSAHVLVFGTRCQDLMKHLYVRVHTAGQGLHFDTTWQAAPCSFGLDGSTQSALRCNAHIEAHIRTRVGVTYVNDTTCVGSMLVRLAKLPPFIPCQMDGDEARRSWQGILSAATVELGAKQGSSLMLRASASLTGKRDRAEPELPPQSTSGVAQPGVLASVTRKSKYRIPMKDGNEGYGGP